MTTQDRLPQRVRDLIRELDAKTAASVRKLPTDAADDAGRRERVERTYVETLGQPQAIAETLRATAGPVRDLAATLRRRQIDRVYLVGCGDSWFVGIGVRLLFERLLGVPCEALQALEYAHYYFGPTDAKTLVIGTTSGGNTPRTVEALAMARAAGAFTVGITNTAPSAVTQETDAQLLIAAERRGWPTQASTSSVAALALLAAKWAEAANLGQAEVRVQVLAGLSAMPDTLARILHAADRPMAAVAEELHAAPIYLFAGAGPALAAASFGAAKVKELCPVHAVSMPLEEHHHYRSQKPGDPLFLVAPRGPSTQRALETLQESRRFQGVSVALIDDDDTLLSNAADHVLRLPGVSPLLVAIPYAAPLHLFACHLAMAKFGHGEGYPGRRD